MQGIFKAVGQVFKRDSAVVIDTEDLGNALVSSHHYLHHVLLAGNFSDVGEPIGYPAVQKTADDETLITN